jgi:hypothetical protein
MPTGVSPLYRPKRQPDLPVKLHPEQSYFLIALHAVQAYFAAGWLTKPGYLTISSTVETSFYPNQTIRNLHQVTTLRRNTPCQVGLRVNLTDWLPALSTGSVRITLNYTVTQDTPFKNLVDQMDRIDLVSKVSLVRPDWGAAVKVSEITGRLLSYFLQEGQTKSVFDLSMDLNLQDLQAGYYAVFGSPENVAWPTELWLNEQAHLTGESYLLDKLCYAAVRVLALPRRGEEIARGEPWWELLQTARDQVVNAFPLDNAERRKLLAEWRVSLNQVNGLSRQARSFLLAEIREIIGKAQTEVAVAMDSTTTESVVTLPDDLQQILGVSTEAELFDSVRDYQDALEVSHQLLEQYEVET